MCFWHKSVVNCESKDKISNHVRIISNYVQIISNLLLTFKKQNKQKTRYKKLFTHVESHASAVSLLEIGE